MSVTPELQITYKAILDYARERKVIFYSDIAARHNRPVLQLRSTIKKHLNDLMKMCYDRNWPALPVIAVSKDEKIITENRGVFINEAKNIGYTVRDEMKFIETHTSRLYEWAPAASDTLTEDGVIWESASELKIGEERNYWFVGAADQGIVDQTDRFVSEGIWQNGDDGLFADRVRNVRPGDRIAIKSRFNRKKGIPFDNNGKYVAMMAIKAIGTVIKGDDNGNQLEVDWIKFIEPREWYFFQYWDRIQKVAIGKNEDALVRFAFGGEKQDIDFFLQQDFWKEKYTPSRIGEVEGSDNKEGNGVQNPKARLEAYGVSNIIDDGCFLGMRDLEQMLERLQSKKNLILQGPPGTGKSWIATKLAKALIGTTNTDTLRDCIRRIQFHPSTSYEDIIRGFRPTSEGKLRLVDGIFLKMNDLAHRNPNSKIILIIEEINRGNTAQIFGEMLTLIESDKRNKEEAIELVYQKSDRERVSVPSNFYIIGTMNLADRSLAFVDIALRRRFAFEVLQPIFDERWMEWCIDTCKLDRDVMEKIGNAVLALNENILEDRGPDYLIGHSYITPTEENNIDDPAVWFLDVVRTEIEPLLKELWLENDDKVKQQVRKLKESVR